MIERIFTVFCPFGGSAGGARGFQKAEARAFGRRGRFRLLGGIDIDPTACRNFKYLTGVEEACADVAALTPADLRRIVGETAPDVLFGSPPCQGSSKLITDAKAKEPHYEALNRLSVIWTRLMLATWSPGPKLVLFENVPHVVNRAKDTLDEVRALLRDAGYLFHDGFHDAGELGGLAQTRKRWLMVARDPKRVPPFLYQPPKKRVRGCGEVIGPLPMPGDPAGGPMHRLPAISVLNWLRLALIPAGGDWRDLPGVLVDGQQRRTVFRRQHVAGWKEPSVTIAGSGSNGPCAVADPRIRCAPFAGAYGVTDWEMPASTVTGAAKIDNRPVAVADPRLIPQASNEGLHYGKYRVRDWDQPAATVIGATRVGSGAQSVADPRLAPPRPAATNFPSLGIVPWGAPTGTVTGQSLPANGGFSVADPRVGRAYDHGYAVLDWREPSSTVAGKSHPGNGAYSVADPRLGGAVGLIPLAEARKLLDGSGPWAIVDRGSDGAPLMIIRDLAKAPPRPLMIVADDGTWHRPLTTLELAVLQSLPSVVDGAPLVLEGGSTEQRKHIGNLVPEAAAEAIAVQMLVTLLTADADMLMLSSNPVWVTPPQAGVLQ